VKLFYTRCRLREAKFLLVTGFRKHYYIYHSTPFLVNHIEIIDIENRNSEIIDYVGEMEKRTYEKNPLLVKIRLFNLIYRLLTSDSSDFIMITSTNYLLL
jgi:hypothetical protein